jgi:tetratricopeptide (TPR) repeat protein
LYLSIYKKNRPSARQFADSMLALAPSVMRGSSWDASAHQHLALAYAAKGDNQRRLEQAELAMRKAPISVDVLRGTANLVNLANSAVVAGSYDEALSLLMQVLARPSPTSAALLRVDPWFDPLRSDPRFQNLLAEND